MGKSNSFETKCELYDLVYSKGGYAVLFKKTFVPQPNERLGSEKFNLVRDKLNKQMGHRSEEKNHTEESEVSPKQVVSAKA